MEKIEIKNWSHAIELTIERHQAVLDEKFTEYYKAKKAMKPDNWNHICPLCEFSGLYGCEDCIWLKYKGYHCINEAEEWMSEDKKSIKRLKEWLNKIKAEENEH